MADNAFPLGIAPRQPARSDFTLAFYPADRYLSDMVIDTVRRISAVILALALVFGPAGGGVYASLGGVKAAVMVASGDSHSPGNCNDCGAGKGGIPAGLCSSVAFCSGFAITPAGHFTPERLPAGRALAYEAHYLTGRADAPDPYPPRSTS
jgi:hypothetical protein